MEETAKVDSTADVVYKKVKRGENFGALAADYSNDYTTANNKGDMGEIGLGKFDKDFEEKIFALKNVGDISEKIHTKFGIHIIKLLEVNPIAKTLDDANYASTLKVKLDNSDRLSIAKKNLLTKWKTLTGFRKGFYSEASVWGFIDSTIMDRPVESFIGVAGDSTVLFSFKKQNIKVADFIEYVKSVRFSETENGLKPYEELIKVYEDQSTIDYYKNHIDEYNKATQQQLKEFDEANLLFAAMDKNVWSKASEDTVGLKDYYKQNMSKYSWKPGVAAVTISANSLTLATDLYEKITQNPADWKIIVAAEGAKATSDSGRFEFDQMPVKAAIEKKVGFISKPEKMGGDETFSFIYITGIINDAQQRSFEDARGLVINDYQQVLEQNWLTQLKKKYPVMFKEDVWKTIK
ncbi:MAG: peptidylprolyl isomerase [Bacteroidetes bacterium]|nr:peptidylprolyl isomerase [Bacteroidota bacterium]